MIDILGLAGMFLAPLGIVSVLPSEAVSPSPAAVCATGEHVLFQCGMGSRCVAVCAGRQPNGRYVQYRFGTGERIELEYPRGRSGSGTLAYARAAYSGGGEAQIHFRNGAFTYVVFSRTVRTGFGPDGNRPEFTAGLFVQRGGKTVSRRSCTAPSDADLDLAAAERALPAGDFIDDIR